ncbi:hypothetical protein SLEP1_g24011 [Rubroshorea leprosula]|uniref:Uncharacterized protein n=1 Tax=Rubroshorea leprosula TaxID=152421 RepID=A0AAV5JNF5_9ROSI|nr:hypothetical protein SLEP1_g24011 [Rubroshorea leprosula]
MDSHTLELLVQVAEKVDELGKIMEASYQRIANIEDRLSKIERTMSNEQQHQSLFKGDYGKFRNLIEESKQTRLKFRNLIEERKQRRREVSALEDLP